MCGFTNIPAGGLFLASQVYFRFKEQPVVFDYRCGEFVEQEAYIVVHSPSLAVGLGCFGYNGDAGQGLFLK